MRAAAEAAMAAAAARKREMAVKLGLAMGDGNSKRWMNMEMNLSCRDEILIAVLGEKVGDERGFIWWCSSGLFFSGCFYYFLLKLLAGVSRES